MLDRDLADLYGVPTKRLNEAVRRNGSRFPSDFMFQLSHHEVTNLKPQFATSSPRWGGRRKLPFAFTEQGVAMLSAVLRSERAIDVNVAIMRAFVRLRRVVSADRTLEKKIAEMEATYDSRFKIVFEAIRRLMFSGPLTPKRIRGLSQDSE